MPAAIAGNQPHSGGEAKPVSDDHALVLRTIHGDTTAFDALVRRYQRLVVALTRRMTFSPEDAEDLTQQAFLKAFSNLSRFQFRCSFSIWLVSIAINETRMWSRKRRRSRELPMIAAGAESDSPVPFDFPDHGPDPESSYLARERQELLSKELQCLPSFMRVAFESCDLEQLPTLDAATCLGISVSALKSRRSRGRALLRRRLKPRLANRQAA
jgi:RNA polymerase sigma-70 factor (ECF subfamily)